jgi:cation diffusion facilitator family transporter
MKEVHNLYRTGYRVALIVLWLTLLILTIKLWAGWATRSLSLLAEALHVLVDSFSTLLSIYAISSLHQTNGQEICGHRKRETLAIFLLVALLGFLGCNLFGIAVSQFHALMYQTSLLAAIQVDPPLIALLGIVASIHLCLVLFERYESRVLKIAALRHNANHILQDMWLTLLMLLGLIGVSWGYVWLDSLMAIVLLIMLIPSVWSMLNRQLPSLIYQVAIAPEVLAQLALQVEGVASCQRIRSKGMIGRQVLIQMHISLHPDFADIGNLVIERLEYLLRERYGPVQIQIDVKQFTQPQTSLTP